MATLSSKTGLPSFTTGGGGSGGRNYVFSPSTYVPAATANDLGWFNSGGTPTTITTGLPRESDLSAIQFVSTSIGDYLRYRFKADDADISRRLQVLFAETAVFGDFKLQVFSGTNAALASPLEIITQSLYTNSSGVMNLPTGTLDILANFDLTTRQYYEVRWTALAGAKTIKISGVNIGAGFNSSSAQNGSDWQQILFPQLQAAGNLGNGVANNTAWFYKFNSTMFVKLRCLKDNNGGSGTNTVTLTMPAGHTIDVAKTPNLLLGNGAFTGTNFGFRSDAKAISATTFGLVKGGTGIYLQGQDFTANGEINFELAIPIVEWANSATVSTINPIAQSPIRAGIIMPFAGATTPTGWLDCDGSQYSQNQYPQLFAQIGTAWATCTNPLTGSAYAAPSAGNFRVPDLRGVFLRGAGTFTDSIGTDTTLAGYQTDQVQGHTHTIQGNGGTGGAAKQITYLTNAGAPAPGGVSGLIDGPFTDGTNGTPRQGKENRPRNVGVRYIIKAWDESFNLAGFAQATATNMGLVSGQVSPINLTPSDLTSQAGCSISAVTLCKWGMVGNLVTFAFRIDNFTITAGTAGFSFTLPSNVPRPTLQTFSTITVYDNSGSAAVLCEAAVTIAGVFQVNKASGGTFTGGPGSNFMRGQISWFTS